MAWIRVGLVAGALAFAVGFACPSDEDDDDIALACPDDEDDDGDGIALACPDDEDDDGDGIAA